MANQEEAHARIGRARRKLAITRFPRSVPMQCYSPTATPNGRIPTVPGQGFVSKHLNICDVLIPNNNLGRSVSRASFARIRKVSFAGSFGIWDLVCGNEVVEGVWSSL